MNVKVFNPRTKHTKEYPAATWKLIKNSSSNQYIEMDKHYQEGIEKASKDEYPAEDMKRDIEFSEGAALEGEHWKSQIAAVEGATSILFLEGIEEVATSKKVLTAIKSKKDDLQK